MGRLSWQLGAVVATQAETARARSITLTVPTWMGHRAGQHMEVRLTAEDGYQAGRSYAIASPPEEAPRVTLTIERLDDGEVSPPHGGAGRDTNQPESRPNDSDRQEKHDGEQARW